MPHSFPLPHRGWLSAAALAALLVTVRLGPHGAAQSTPARAAVPDSAAQTRAASIIRKIFKEEYGRVERDPGAGRELAATLLQQARTIADSPALRFVALREARDLAAQAGDVAAAYQAVADMARDFAIDPLAARTEALARAGQKAGTAAAHKALAEAALSLLDEALAEGSAEAILRLSAVAEQGAAKARNLPLVVRVQKRTRELEPVRKQLEALRPAAERLRVNPNDPEANLTLGRYYCLARGKWDRGLPLLALGADSALKDLARRDLAKPEKAADRAAVADDWWAVSEQVREPAAKKHLQERAALWYLQAVAGLQGAVRARAEKRLASTGVAVPPAALGLIRTFTGHTQAVRSAALSPDGRFAVSGGDDDELRLWDIATGKQVRALTGHTDQVWSVAFSPDGKHILSSGDDRTVRLWEAASGKEVRRFTGHTDNVNRVAFSPDGRFAVSGSDDKTLRLWVVQTGKEMRRFEGHQKPIWGAAFSRDGKKIVSGAEDRTVGVWNADTGQELQTLEGHGDFVLTVAFLPDGKRVLSGGKDRTVRLWDVAARKELKRFTGHTGTVYCVAVSPDGRRVLSSGDDKTVRLWDVDTGAELHRFTGHTEEVGSVVFSADGRHCLSAGADKTVRLWELPK